MKKLLLCVALLSFFSGAIAQNERADSLKKELQKHPAKDTFFVGRLYMLSYSLMNNDIENALLYTRKGIELSKELKWNYGIIGGLRQLSNMYISENKFDSAVYYSFDALKISEETGNDLTTAYINADLGEAYRMMDNDSLAEYHYKKLLSMSRNLQNKRMILTAMTDLAVLYEQTGAKQLRDNYSDTALQLATTLKNKWSIANMLEFKATRQFEQKDFKSALNNYRGILLIWKGYNNFNAIAWIQTKLSDTFRELNNKDSAAYYANAALETSKQNGLKKEIIDAYYSLFNYAERFKDYKKALEYRLIYDSLDKETNKAGVAKNSERIRIDYDQKKKDLAAQIELSKKDNAAKRSRDLLYTGIVLFMLLAAFLFWNNRQKQKAKNKIEFAYSDLKSTQQQLIQSEKMASLGELTAGIAHEIQNPLNFVNNFSEINKELIGELVEEVDKGNTEEVKAIANDIKENSEKINHHGRRADAIVKGMLQHSRSSSGVKEPTDINDLCDEYLRLSYHGLRAKDKSFNATMKTDFDESIGKINIIPQEIGRVILNLLTNAFYAVGEKKTLRQAQGDTSYEPTVSISTQKINDKVAIKITDNGNGIPQNIVDKIFQPFFTTKPTGQGTGLGLSLSYDIIKAHGGEIKAETKEGEGTSFMLFLSNV